MQVTVQMVCDWLDGLAPFDTAEAYDNVGLLVGRGSAVVEKILFCVDATHEVVQEAVRQGAELIIAHHPLMFGGIRRIDYEAPEGRILQALLAARLSLIAAHTNLDKAPGGIGDSLTQALGLGEVRSLGVYARMGILPQALEAAQLQAHVSRCLGTQARCYGQASGPISRVAAGPGAAGDGAQEAALAGAQAYVVGEIKHHEVLQATARGLLVLEAGHYATEAVGMKVLCEGFQAMAAEKGWSAASMWFSQAPFSGALCR